MNIRLSLLTLSFLLACQSPSGGESTKPATRDNPTNTAPKPKPDVSAAAPQHTQGPHLIDHARADGDLFSTSQNCKLCHSNHDGAKAMRDPAGAPVAPFDLWQSTMMANAARDPLWRAVMSAEILAAPDAKDAIEQKCMGCHTPMGTRESAHTHTTVSAQHLYQDQGKLSQLSIDGVSCTVCHQIQADNLGEEESFDAGFIIKQGGYIFGPHSELFSNPMEMHAGFIPMHGVHILDSALCATCHTVITHPLSSPETAFLEQAPYLEWRNSDFSNEKDTQHCQDCHVPQTNRAGQQISTRIARNPVGEDFEPIEPRQPYGRHIFVGGNTLIPAILRDHADELRPQASTEAFNATIAETRYQLQNHTARLSMGDIKHNTTKLHIPITITNLAGHKLPTGFPNRRIWLAVKVTNAQGQIVFQTGQHDTRGRLLDAQGQIRPEELAGGPHYAHRNRVDANSPPAVFEARMANAAGQPTFRVTQAASMHSDNRLLPRGWRADHADAQRTQPVGTEKDANFKPGQDTVEFVVAAPSEKGPHTLEATLYYQVLSPRFAQELFLSDTPEVRAFKRYYEQAQVTPEKLSSVTMPLER